MPRGPRRASSAGEVLERRARPRAAPDGRRRHSRAGRRRGAQARQTKPACLPEQLLCSAVGAPPARGERPGRGLVERPVRAAFERARRRARPCASIAARAPRHARGSPACEAQASASSSSVEAELVGGAALDQRQRLQRLDGRARIDAAARRRRATAPPRRRRRRPRSRRDGAISTAAPRVTSTRTGLSMTPPVKERGFVRRRAGPVKGTGGETRPGRLRRPRRFGAA